jgi:prephenate dehydrogenase
VVGKLFLENSDLLCETIDRFIADLNVIKDTVKQKSTAAAAYALQESNSIKKRSGTD